MDADRQALIQALREPPRPAMSDGQPLTAEQYYHLLQLKDLHENGTTKSPYQGIFSGTGPRNGPSSI